MNTYYLTEMNLLKLENALLTFIYKQNLNKMLVNGVTAKIIAMMYNNNIDYYYSDAIATAVDVDIKFVNQIYVMHQAKYYDASLSALLSKTEYGGSTADAKKLEQNIMQILETKKKINTTKNNFKRCKNAP